MIANVALPRILRIGGGALRETGALLSDLGLKRPLIVTDRFLLEQGLAKQLCRVLDEAGFRNPRVFAGAVPDPTVASIEAGLGFLREAQHDCVLGLGGGSSIDTAKAIAMLAVHAGQMRDYKAPHQQNAPGLPVVAIPTTAGTGSEATRFTIVTDQETGEKMLCLSLIHI